MVFLKEFFDIVHSLNKRITHIMASLDDVRSTIVSLKAAVVSVSAKVDDLKAQVAAAGNADVSAALDEFQADLTQAVADLNSKLD